MSREAETPRWPERLTQAAFLLALVLVIARAMSLETLRDPFEITPGSAPVPRALTAAASVVVDWLALLPALLILLRRAVDRSYQLIWRWSFIPIFALAVWAMLSARWSNDRFAAIVGSSHFIAAVALMWSATQLVRSGLRLRLVAGACFGLLLALVAHGLIYWYIELPDLQQSLEAQWPTILQQRGWELDSFVARQFRQRLVGGDMMGFNTSSNTFAALLVMCAIVAIGIAIQRRANRDAMFWTIIIAISLLPVAWALQFTRSRAAFVTPFLAAGLLALIGISRPLLARRHRSIFIAALVLIAVAIGSIVALGLSRNNLLHDSLTFRWRYWIGAARIVEQHPIAGVGWNNFGGHYLAVRVPIASEEVKDPHNLFVRIATELGIIGLVLLLAWLVLSWWRMTRPTRELLPIESSPRYGREVALPALLAMSIGAMLCNTLISIDLAQSPAWVLIEVLKRTLYAGLILGGLIVASFRSFDRQELDDRPAPWLQSAILVALAIFLLHNAIDFSFFETGPMWIFMLLVGSVLGVNADASMTPSRKSAWPIVVCALGAIAWLGSAIGLIAPLISAESAAVAGDDALRQSQPSVAIRLYREAFDTLPFANADYLYRAGRAQMYASRPANEVVQTLTAAIDIDPTNAAALALLARVEADRPGANPISVHMAFNRALRNDPQDVQLRLLFAQTLEKLDRRLAAISEYSYAVAIDSQLDPNDPKRLSVAKKDQIEQKIAELRRSVTP